MSAIEASGATTAFHKPQPDLDYPRAVRVTAADFNGTTWDGSPFSATPQWLQTFIRNGIIVGHTRGSTDYASWDVLCGDGMKTAGPGDWIVYRRDRSLSVVQYEDARELELVIKTSAGA